MERLTLFSLLLKKWKAFLLTCVLAGTLGIFIAWLIPPSYQSRLSFALDAGTSESGFSGAINLASQLGFGFGGSGSLFEGDNIIEIIKSRRMIEKVLLTADTFNNQQKTLADIYIETTGYRKKLESKSRTKGIQFPVGASKSSLSYLQDSILNVVYLELNQECISASRPDKKLSIYELKVKSPNERLSKVFTDRLTEEAGAFYTEITSKKDRETVELLEQRVDSLKNSVGSSIVSKAVAQDANLNPAFSIAQTNSQYQQYNIMAYGEAYKELFKNLEMAKYQYLKKIPLLQIIDHADYPMEKIRFSKAKMAIYFSTIAFLLTLLFYYQRNKIEVEK
jgi:uncharacterized protein involved in exopolysaccharide biosynthesis